MRETRRWISRPRYLGLTLKIPLVASASPLTLRARQHQRALEDAGAGAVVLPSIFQEQIEARGRRTSSALTGIGADSFPEALDVFPAAAHDYRGGPHRYLDTDPPRARRGRHPGDRQPERHHRSRLDRLCQASWSRPARSAIELNIYFVPTDPTLDGGEVEQRHLDVLRAVKAAVTLPIAVKLEPVLQRARPHGARSCDAAGADGFVLFNRFYQPDIDLARAAAPRS